MVAWLGDKEEQAGSTDCRPQWASRLVRISTEGREPEGKEVVGVGAENWQHSRLLLIPGLV